MDTGASRPPTTKTTTVRNGSTAPRRESGPYPPGSTGWAILAGRAWGVPPEERLRRLRRFASEPVGRAIAHRPVGDLFDVEIMAICHVLAGLDQPLYRALYAELETARSALREVPS